MASGKDRMAIKANDDSFVFLPSFLRTASESGKSSKSLKVLMVDLLMGQLCPNLVWKSSI